MANVFCKCIFAGIDGICFVLKIYHCTHRNENEKCT